MKGAMVMCCNLDVHHIPQCSLDNTALNNIEGIEVLAYTIATYADLLWFSLHGKQPNGNSLKM